MYQYQTGISAQEQDQFVKNHPQCNLLQSSNWAKVKDNWGNERVGFYKDGELVACCSILIRPLPLGRTMFYIPRGPILDYEDQELVRFVLSSLKEIAKKHKALFIKFDPSLYLSKGLIGEERKDKPATLAILKNLQENGCDWLGRTEDLDQTVQPRFHANIYQEYFAEDQISKSTRQAIRTAKNKGIEVQVGGLDLLDDFAKLMQKTENRKNINLRGKDYYQKLLETYPDSSYITMSFLPLQKRMADLNQQLKKLEQEAQKFTEKTKPSKIKNHEDEVKRLSEEKAFLEEKAGQGEKIPLSGTLTLIFGTTSENIYAGMDEDYRRYQPAILTWYETAQEAFRRDCSTQNMGGIENQLDGGLYHFKSKFNPVIEEFVGEFNLSTSPFYPLFNLAYTLRKKLRKKY